MSMLSMLIHVTSPIFLQYSLWLKKRKNKIVWPEHRTTSTTCRTGCITLLQLSLNSYYAEDYLQSLQSSKIQLNLKGLFRRLSRIPFCFGTEKFTLNFVYNTLFTALRKNRIFILTLSTFRSMNLNDVTNFRSHDAVCCVGSNAKVGSTE